jgi:RNA polymerase primary sigma factor
MVRSNLGLVVKIAQRYARYGVPLPDLIQEGNVGLLKALERFDPERGFKFSTYAGWWIRHAVQRAIANTGRTIRLPVHRHELYRRMRRVARELAQALEREPLAGEIAGRVGVSPRTVEQVLEVSAEPRSLHEPLRGHDHALLGDMISGGQWAFSEDSLAEQELSRRVVGLLDVLSPRERHVLKARFGLDDAHGHTLEEIGRGLGLSRERVRQIEVLAVEKLRSAALAEGLVQ